jgi:exodeoxyribonuclease V gamma subunit
VLRIQFSNRIETLCDSLVDAQGRVPASPFAAQQIVVPSSAMRRYLTLAIARRHGICANVDGVYLAQWLWQQIAKVVPTVADESPFAASALAWRIYQILGQSTWDQFPRLARYLHDPSPALRFELAAEIAALFEQYITYRQDWMSTWLQGDHVPLPQASAAQRDDQAWQAELWRRIGGELGAAPEHPAGVFLRRIATDEAAGRHPDLPDSVHVFCLPAMPPLYLEVLTGLARWVDITVHVLNPCREYWFDIVAPKRLRALAVRGAASHHDSGNRLLASWGGQTRAHIELLLARSGDAPLDDEGFDEQFADSMLGRLQHAIFTLAELEPASLAPLAADRSIEVHICHSLTRELEVLQDQLLAVFAGASPPRPEEVLIVTPDLETAAPLIEAVFGNVPDERRLPYAITGRGRSSVNPAARALLAVLAILPSRFPASALVELLQQPLIGRRFHIGVDELAIIEAWMHDSGIRWGLDAAHRRELAVPGTDRFTLADGLDRLFLGYALPQHTAAPSFDRIPAGNAEGSQAEILGAFAEFVEQLTALRAQLREPRLPDAWLGALLAILDDWLAPAGNDAEDFAEVRETLRELHDGMRRGGLAIPLPLAVVRSSLEALFDDAARGGVPTGAITFSSMSSLRNLPFRFIGILGLNDGAFPSPARPREFDLMTAAPRAGDRQRRLDDRNLFLDLLLAARERLYLSYTGRSIRDNSVRPPSVVVAELLETLLPAVAQAPGDSAALTEARRHLLVENPLQAFAARYFQGDDPRRRSFNRELCDALRHALAAPAAAPVDRSGSRFFTAPLTAPGPEWRRVSLDQLHRFFRNPCRYLLRERLGLSLYREEDGVADEEPFLLEFLPRQALAERLLPQALQGLDTASLSRLAQAGVEYPPGALGLAALADEMSALQRFARGVRDATAAPRLPSLAVDLPFLLDGEDWRLTGVVSERYPGGIVLNRYDDARPTDYLSAWLTHLAASAGTSGHATTPAPAPFETRWIARDRVFRFTSVADPQADLRSLLLLYRRGLCEPVHFFPKSAWAYIRGGRDLKDAHATWHATHANGHGEDEQEAYRLALRGIANPLDADFEVTADTVFGAAVAHLDDATP